MECRRCGTALERPGDYCLECDSSNADAIVVDVDPERATVSVLDDGEVLAETVVTTVPEDDDERRPTAVRNYAGRIADEVRRKRPDAVYAAGEREVVRALRATLRYDVRRVDDETPVEAALARRGDRDLDVVEKPPLEKIGGSHSTLIGGRTGMDAIRTVAEHPNVKKVVPGPIDASGASSSGGLHAKATRADAGGNVRLLLREGSSVQENRVVTTARDRDGGERVRAALNEVLAEAEFQ